MTQVITPEFKSFCKANNLKTYKARGSLAGTSAIWIKFPNSDLQLRADTTESAYRTIRRAAAIYKIDLVEVAA